MPTIGPVPSLELPPLFEEAVLVLLDRTDTIVTAEAVCPAVRVIRDTTAEDPEFCSVTDTTVFWVAGAKVMTDVLVDGA